MTNTTVTFIFKSDQLQSPAQLLLISLVKEKRVHTIHHLVKTVKLWWIPPPKKTLTICHCSHCLSSPPSTWAAIMTLIAQALTFPLRGLHTASCLKSHLCSPGFHRSACSIPKVQRDRRERAPLPFINNVCVCAGRGRVRRAGYCFGLCVSAGLGSGRTAAHCRPGRLKATCDIWPRRYHFSWRRAGEDADSMTRNQTCFQRAFIWETDVNELLKQSWQKRSVFLLGVMWCEWYYFRLTEGAHSPSFPPSLQLCRDFHSVLLGYPHIGSAVAKPFSPDWFSREDEESETWRCRLRRFSKVWLGRWSAAVCLC